MYMLWPYTRFQVCRGSRSKAVIAQDLVLQRIPFAFFHKKSMPNGRLHNGIGAKCSVLKRFLHSCPIIDAKYPNATQNERLDSLLVIRREIKRVKNREQWCIIFRHDDFENLEIYCTERYCKVTEQGPAASFFQQDAAVPPTAPGEETVVEEAPTALPTITHKRGEDIANMRRLNFDVDDDNKPAPENVPTATTNEGSNDNTMYKEWRGTSVDHCRAAGH